MKKSYLIILMTIFVSLLLFVFSIIFSSSIQAQPNIGSAERSSIASEGSEANGSSWSSSISADGRYVIFESAATNLVSGDTNSVNDIFVHDQQTGETTRVSVASDGSEANGKSSTFGGASILTISADGRFVGFSSRASNLVPSDTNNLIDVFIHDRETGQTTRVSVDSNGTQANGDSGGVAISSNGRFVAFQSVANNLVISDTNGTGDIFVHDRESGQTTRVSVDSNGTQADGWSDNEAVSISGDGRYIAFYSDATNLVDNDTNDMSDVFVHDRQTGETTRVSIASDGSEASEGAGGAAISTNGRFVAFSSDADDELVDNDTNGLGDAIIHDRQTGETTRVSIASVGSETNGPSWSLSVSADGRYVAFGSQATNLVSDDTNGTGDIFIHDRETGQTTLASVASDGSQGSADVGPAVISSDGRYVTFSSNSNNLVQDDTNGVSDVFVHDRNTGQTARVSVASEYNNPLSCSSEEDTDGDGLIAGWEICGYYVGGFDPTRDPDVDLPAMGADPKHKDIFVEIDYMARGPYEYAGHKPSHTAIETIVNSFNNAPVNNPDGVSGIHLHVDYGPDAPLVWGAAATWDSLSRAEELPHQDYIGSCPLGIFQWNQFDAIKNGDANNVGHFDEERLQIFHYNNWVHSLCSLKSTTSGISRNKLLTFGSGASDFIVSLRSPSDNEQAGTFMHELGHNLGLFHGGDDHSNYKPNYLSVMNYSFQMNGLIMSDNERKFDYSRWDLPSLNEFLLNETIGIRVPASENVTYGTKWYCSIIQGRQGKMTHNASTVDWNCDGDENDKLLTSEDINRDFLNTNLSGFNDWANLVYDGGAVSGLGIGEELPIETEIDELTDEEAATIPITRKLYLPFVVGQNHTPAAHKR